MLSAASIQPFLFLQPPQNPLLSCISQPLKPHVGPLLRPISATFSPSSPSVPPSPSPNQNLYLPFRPPPPQKPSLSFDAILDVLRNRLGLWHEYAPLIPVLSRYHSFTSPDIEESTGITGIEQNRLIVAAQVRDSLLPIANPDVVSFFDAGGGAELLYELRFLSAPQRAAAASRISTLHLDPKAAQLLARAMKDFPRRRAEKGWTDFSASSPGDCLAFMYFRQSREFSTKAERTAALDRATEAAESDSAHLLIARELERISGTSSVTAEEGDEDAKVSVPVVRMKIGEVAEATSVRVLPVVREAEEGVVAALEEAPACWAEGEFGLVVAEKGWKRWVVLPGWKPLAGIRSGGVAVSFGDGRVLPWKVNRGYMEEEILVIADREKKEVLEDEGFYLVLNKEEEKGGLSVVRGDKLKGIGMGVSLGMVVLVVRPPKEEVYDQLKDDDWE